MSDVLRTVLNPKSVAVIGASENENKIGGTRGHVSAAGARLRAAGRSSAGPLPPLPAPTRIVK